MATLSGFIGRLLPGLKRFLGTLLTLVVVLVIIAVGELLPPLQALDLYLKAHRQVEQGLLWLTIVMALSGTAILALSQLLPEPRLPEGMSRADVEAQSPPIKYRESRWSSRHRWGRAFSGEASMGAVKQAWRGRAWRYDIRWRLLFVMMLGALLVLFGLFGLFIVIGEPGVKFLMILVLLYALGQTLRGFLKS